MSSSIAVLPSLGNNDSNKLKLAVIPIEIAAKEFIESRLFANNKISLPPIQPTAAAEANSNNELVVHKKTLAVVECQAQTNLNNDVVLPLIDDKSKNLPKSIEDNKKSESGNIKNIKNNDDIEIEKPLKNVKKRKLIFENLMPIVKNE